MSNELLVDKSDKPNRGPRQASTGDRGLSEHYHVDSQRVVAMPAAKTPREGSIGRIDAKLVAKKWLNQSRRNRLMNAVSQNNNGREFRVDSMSEAESERSSLIKKAGGKQQGVLNSGSIPEGGPPHLPTVKPTTAQFLKIIIFGKMISIFLILIPVALWASFRGWSPVWVFWLNFFVMVPLAAILGDFTEEVALHTNQTIGGLVNATFGNAVEVVVAVQALLANEIRVVQASMIGSIFSNLLLVLGCCFFFGGLKYKEQSFNSTAATANMGLLALSSIALVLPTPFAEYYDVNDAHVLLISRFAAVFLMFMYIQLLIFQLKTHAHIFDEAEHSPSVPAGEKSDVEEEAEEEEDEVASISMSVAIGGLLASTLLVTFFSEFLVGSIDGYCETSDVSRTFVGLIILPIVGNAVEHITAISVAMKDKMDLAMGVAVGSCTQISLFVVPLTVLVGWAMDKPMTLNFPHFEVTLYILSVFTVSVCLSNPRSNWLEGSLLITTYAMIAVGFWFEKVEDF